MGKVLFFFFKNRIKIESARVRGSNKDGIDVFLAILEDSCSD